MDENTAEDPGPLGKHFKPLGMGSDVRRTGTIGGGPCRMTARGQIEQRIGRLRREADNLEALLKALPMELPPAADEALWTMTNLRI